MKYLKKNNSVKNLKTFVKDVRAISVRINLHLKI